MADLGHVNEGRRRISARGLTAAEFADIQSTYRTIGLWCVECGGEMYPQRRTYLDGTLQLFVHMPGTLETCSARHGEGGESSTHAGLKDVVAHIAETTLGLRAEQERKFAGHRPDVLLYAADKPSDYGPIACYEIQHSPIPIEAFDWRDSRVNAALRRLQSGTYERRIAPWLFTHTPSFGVTRAHLEVTQRLDDTWNATGVRTEHGDETHTAQLAAVMADMHAGRIVRIDDRVAGAPVSYLTTLSAAQRRPRREAQLRQTGDKESAACDRPATATPRAAQRRPASTSYTASWDDGQWRSCASFARIKQALGRTLEHFEIEALRRHPSEPEAGSYWKQQPRTEGV